MKKYKEILNKLFDAYTKDVELYRNGGSIWLIFTENKKWVIELTKEETLWYNYRFFNNIFRMLSLDLINNQDYITEWVEETIINGVKRVPSEGRRGEQMGRVKDTKKGHNIHINSVGDAIQNGIKETISETENLPYDVEDAILNGVKMVVAGECERTNPSIEDIIKSGVKNRIKNTWTNMIPNEYDWSDDFNKELEDVIQNGVKETKPMDEWVNTNNIVNKVIVNGVKEVKPAYTIIYNPMNCESVITEEKRIPDVTDVIRDGIKEVQPLPAQDGNRDFGVYYNRQEDRTKPHTQYVNDVIQNGDKII
jgi:hypothetical protein